MAGLAGWRLCLVVKEIALPAAGNRFPFAARQEDVSVLRTLERAVEPTHVGLRDPEPLLDRAGSEHVHNRGVHLPECQWIDCRHHFFSLLG
jgi:hypothetical protein